MGIKKRVNRIIGELDPDQQKCTNCKEFKSKKEFIGAGFLESACKRCRIEITNRVKRSRQRKYGKDSK